MKSPVIIVGAARSGTSMMMSMIKNFLGYSGHHEAHFFTLLDQLICTTEEHFQPLRNAFQNRSEVLVFEPGLEIKQDLKDLFKSYIREVYGNNPWFLKTPNPSAIKALPLILELYPEAKVIYLKRRGVENVLSQSRKFGDGSFRPGFCTNWSESIISFFEGNQFQNCLVVDQLAYLLTPEKVISKLLDHLEIEASTRLTSTLKNYLLTNPVEQTAQGTTNYIALEETPWSTQDREVFLHHCQEAMHIGRYPITRAEIDGFVPNDSFLFSGNFRQDIQVLHAKTPWNTIPSDVFAHFRLHPNPVKDDPLTLLLTLPTTSIRMVCKMLNPSLVGKGITISVEEIDESKKPIRQLDTITLQCLETREVHWKPQTEPHQIKICIANEEGSQNYNHKLVNLEMFKLP